MDLEASGCSGRNQLGRTRGEIAKSRKLQLARLIHAPPSSEMPPQRHVAVVIHRDQSGREKGYFFDSAEGDHGGSGPFDWNRDEAIERAKRFANDLGIQTVVIRAAG